MKTFIKIISLLTKDERKRGLLVLLLIIGMALLETVGVASVIPFLAVLGNPEIINTNPVLRMLYINAKIISIQTIDDFIVALGICSFILIILSATYRTFTHYIMNRYVEMRRHSISTRLLEAYLRQPYLFFLDRHSGDMSKIILSEVDQLIGNVFRPAYSLFAYSFVLIALSTLLIITNPWLVLLAAGLLGGLYAITFLIVRNKIKNLGSILVSSNKERFMAAGETFSGIKDIKLLGRETSYLSRFSKPSKKFAASHADHHTLNQVPHFIIEAFVFGTMLILIVVLMIISGGFSSKSLGHILPVLGLYAFAAYRMKPAFHHIYEGFASLRYGQAIVESVYNDMYPNKKLEQLPKNDIIPLKIKNEITLKNISYTYPNSEKPMLKDLDLEIPINSAIGIVGSTGAGKTTLVDIILGLLRPTKGTINVDGSPITDDKLRSWQKSLGYVPQEIFLTDSSVIENIAMGIPKHQINNEQAIRCAKMAQVHDFIMQDLNNNYETLVGERGVRLSGGQRQRIGIARALYHNPEIIVFDEATSALDNITERAVMNSINTLLQKKTIILIAHRLSTVKNCNQILMLENGLIKAKGTYEELIKNNMQFRKIANPEK